MTLAKRDTPSTEQQIKVETEFEAALQGASGRQLADKLLAYISGRTEKELMDCAQVMARILVDRATSEPTIDLAQFLKLLESKNPFVLPWPGKYCRVSAHGNSQERSH